MVICCQLWIIHGLTKIKLKVGPSTHECFQNHFVVDTRRCTQLLKHFPNPLLSAYGRASLQIPFLSNWEIWLWEIMTSPTRRRHLIINCQYDWISPRPWHIIRRLWSNHAVLQLVVICISTLHLHLFEIVVLHNAHYTIIASIQLFAFDWLNWFQSRT